MYLREALADANDGDTVVDRCTRESFLKGDYENISVSLTASISIEWGTIPAEPKVLTVNEALEQTRYNRNHEVAQMGAFSNGFYVGDKNGQLKEWLNHKELRKMAEDFSNCDVKLLWPSNIYEYQDRFKALLDKLKEAKQ